MNERMNKRAQSPSAVLVPPFAASPGPAALPSSGVLGNVGKLKIQEMRGAFGEQDRAGPGSVHPAPFSGSPEGRRGGPAASGGERL